MSGFTQLIIRCRDASLSTHRKTSKTSDITDPEVLAVMSYLNQMIECLFANLFPGANYQRLITCLDLLSVLNACFFAFNPSGVNKGSANGNPEKLVKHLQVIVFIKNTQNYF